MNHEVTASFETLMSQSIGTAEVYLNAASQAIDKQFWDGCALQHPELVAAFMTTCALDYRSSTLLVAAQKIVAGLGDVANAIENMPFKA